jgi:hypothetical protein
MEVLDPETNFVPCIFVRLFAAGSMFVHRDCSRVSKYLNCHPFRIPLAQLNALLVSRKPMARKGSNR